ncbi:MAG: hypothetical protein Q7U83_05595, partial [Daejeonella sp.]|nr:hypothetical protein [Daejeonella sp.]
MKKIITMAILAVMTLSASAQDKGLQGTWFATSQFGYQETKKGNDLNTSFMVLPILGNFISPSVAIGAAVGYSNIKSKSGSVTNANTGLLVVEPLVRKYWNVAGSMFFFGQLALPVISGKEKQSDLKVNQTGLAASGGLDMVLG